MNVIPYILQGDRVVVDYSNPIFLGHFPGKPMLPGVYIIQMATDYASILTGKNLVVKSIKRCRYFMPVSPELGAEYNIVCSVVGTDNDAYLMEFALLAGQTPVAQIKAQLIFL